MHFPVLARDGYHYERWHLQQWLEKFDPDQRRSPMTNKPMALEVRYDTELRSEIDSFILSKISPGKDYDLAGEAPVCGIYSIR